MIERNEHYVDFFYAGLLSVKVCLNYFAPMSILYTLFLFLQGDTLFFAEKEVVF